MPRPPPGGRSAQQTFSDEKLARAQELGADKTINYKTTPQWDIEARRLTGGAGVDLVLETGGSETFPRSVNAAALRGTVFVIGFLSGTEIKVDVLAIVEKELTVQGKRCRANGAGQTVQGNTPGPVAALRGVAAAIAAHKIMPVVDRAFAMPEAADA